MLKKEKLDRPREKLVRLGVEGLTDVELAMAVVGSGNAIADVIKIGRGLVKELCEKEGRVKYRDLAKIQGLGQARICQILASFELMRRFFGTEREVIVDSSKKIVELLTDIRDKKQEYFIALTLDGANRLIKKRVITIGTLTASLVHPREIFAPAVEDRAASIAVAHNHPSGNVEASSADIAITERLKGVGDLLGITLLDHIIVTKDDYRSII